MYKQNLYLTTAACVTDNMTALKEKKHPQNFVVIDKESLLQAKLVRTLHTIRINNYKLNLDTISIFNVLDKSNRAPISSKSLLKDMIISICPTYIYI